MKKIFAAALALTMTAAMFTACGDDSSSSSSAATTTTTAAASSAAEASSADASSTADESSAADASSEDASSEGDSAAAGEFDVTKLPGYDASATETVLTVANPTNSDWANGLGTDDNGNDVYIDARTFTKDQDLTVTVDFELPAEVKEEFDLDVRRFESLDESGVIKKGTTQILVGPARANGWTKFIDNEHQDGMKVDFPTYYNMPEGDTHGKTKSGTDGSEDVYKADGTLEDVFVKNDGFIKFGSLEKTSVTFTIPKETVNLMVDTAMATPEDPNNATVGWDGILFQIAGGVTIKTVKLSQPNIYFSNVVNETFSAE